MSGRDRRPIEEVAIYASIVSAIIAILSIPEIFPDQYERIKSVAPFEVLGGTEETQATPDQSKNKQAGFLAGLWGGMSGLVLLPKRGLPPYTWNNSRWRYHYTGFVLGAFLAAYLSAVFASVAYEELYGKLRTTVVSILMALAVLYLFWFVALFPILNS